MKKIKLITIFSLLAFSASALHAERDELNRLDFDIEKDENGGFRPNLSIPIYWNDNLFSSVGFSDKTKMLDEKLNNVSDSHRAVILDQQNFVLGILAFESDPAPISFSIGVHYGLTKIDKTEYGYYTSQNKLYAFENNIEMEKKGFGFNGDLTFGQPEDVRALRFSVGLSPFDTLDLEQSTMINPITTTPLKSNGSKKQDLSYQLKVKFRQDIGIFGSLVADASYAVLSLNYDLRRLKDISGKYEDVEIEAKETTTWYGIKYKFPKSFFLTMSPTIGIGRELVQLSDNLSTDKHEDTQTILTTGISGSF